MTVDDAAPSERRQPRDHWRGSDTLALPRLVKRQLSTVNPRAEIETWRELTPELQTFETWVTRNAGKLRAALQQAA